MKNDYRLVQVIESIDNITKRPIDIFEMFLIQYNYSRTGYVFVPAPSAKNHFFIYDRSENMEEYYMENKEEIITLDTEDFFKKEIRTPEGIRQTFFSKNLYILRTN